MANNIVEIIIKANNQTGSTFSKLNSGFKELTGFSLGAAGGIALAGKAVQEVGKFLKDAVIETEKYVTSVTDMARVQGLTTEEMSRLIQASDDLFISQEKLNTAMLAASRQGVDTSIEGLKELSGQYLALNPGVDRAQFLMQKFGRSGADMGKLMEVGADGIDTAMASISDSLVVTEDSKQKIIEYKQSVDELTDAWTGFKIEVGTGIIPALTDLLNGLQGNSDWFEKQQPDKLIGQLGVAGGMSAEQIARLKTEMAGMVDPANAAAAATDNLTTSETGLAGQLTSVTQYFKDATTEMLFNKLAQNMTEEAALSLSVQMGLLNPQTYSLMLATQALTEEFDLNKDGVIGLTEMTAEYRAEAERLKASVDLLEDKEITITTYFKSVGQSNEWANSGGYYGSSNPNLLDGRRAYGGDVYAGRPYLVGERGPEVFVPNSNGYVVPNNKIGSANTPVQQPAQTFSIDYDRLARVLTESLERSGLSR